MAVESQRVEDFRLTKEPYYLPLGNEVELFEAAYNARLPVMLKGPTGCGKTRFVEHMSWRLERTLVTVACHEDLTASDLVGKYTLRGDETLWQDGPLTTRSRPAASPTWTRSSRPARTPRSSSTRSPTTGASCRSRRRARSSRRPTSSSW